MGMKMLLCASAFAAICPLYAAAGEANYSEDLMKFLTAPVSDADRGLCVGSDEKCAAEAARRRPVNDLLINFEKNSARLDEASKARLLKASKVFKDILEDEKLSSRTFAIDGYTDASGSDAYNLSLSARRAQTVASFLKGQGVDMTRIQIKGHGKENPRTSDPYDPLNRRVETRVASP